MENESTNQKVSHFAICLQNTEYPVSLELHKLYWILPDDEARQDGDIRIIDESGEDYLYPSDHFLLMTFPQETEQILQSSFAQHLHDGRITDTAMA